MLSKHLGIKILNFIKIIVLACWFLLLVNVFFTQAQMFFLNHKVVIPLFIIKIIF